MNRAIGIPAAVFALVGLPGLVALATEEPEKPPAREAALTIDLEGGEGDDEPYPFIVKGARPAPTKPATLRDDSGRHTGTVEPAAECRGDRLTAFASLPAETEDWCLQLTDVAAGHELTGKVTAAAAPDAADSVLTLTVNRRDHWFGLPLLVLVVGFAIGALVALLKPWLRNPIRSSVLGTLVKDNKAKIVGLEGFVRDRKAAGDSTDALIAKVNEVVTSGPKVAEAARKELSEKLDGPSLPGEHPLLAAAGKEAGRTDHQIGDFYDPAGERVPHPAAELSAALDELPVYEKFLEDLRAEVEDLQAGDERDKAAVAVETAQIAFDRAAKRSDGEAVAGRLKEARAAVDVAVAHELVGLPLDRRSDVASGGADAAPRPPLPLDAAELGGARLARVRLVALGGTILVLGVTLIFSALSIIVTNYLPKVTFDSFPDYFALFTAALGSGAAGAIILWLGYWSPEEPASET